MRYIRTLLVAAAVAALPSVAAAQGVLRPGEFSVGADIIVSDLAAGDFVAADADRNATATTGFNLRYALDNRLALIGTLGFSWVTIADDRDDPSVRYSVGVGGQYNLIQSRSTAFYFRGGLQFVPRIDRRDGDQELGIRLWAGPGVEGRVSDALSVTFHTAMLDLQFGGDTRFDLEIIPTVGLFLFF